MHHMQSVRPLHSPERHTLNFYSSSDSSYQCDQCQTSPHGQSLMLHSGRIGITGADTCVNLMVLKDTRMT